MAESETEIFCGLDKKNSKRKSYKGARVSLKNMKKNICKFRGISCKLIVIYYYSDIHRSNFERKYISHTVNTDKEFIFDLILDFWNHHD